MNVAMRRFVAIFGTIVGFAGLEHGIGELLQGSRPPEGLMFLSWPGDGFFMILSGEPAMSLIPNLLASGIVTIAVALLFIVVAWFFSHRRFASLALISISVVLLLVGGGFGPPLQGIILGIAALKAYRPSRWWGKRLPPQAASVFAGLWRWSIALTIAAWLFMLPGIPLLNHFFGYDDPTLTFTVVGIAFFLIVVTGFVCAIADSPAVSKT
jgi:hypothetical protein